MPSRLEKIFFFLLIFFLPSQLGRHFWPVWSFVSGRPVDFLSPTIYITDLIILSLLIISFFTSLIHHRIALKNYLVSHSNALIIIFLYILLNIIFAFSRPLAFLDYLRILEYFLLYLYLQKNLIPQFSQFKIALSLSLAYTSLLTWLQFIHQASIGGLWYWLGERSFSLATPGVAKFVYQGQQFLRPYATFSHPNSLAAFLLVAGLMLIPSPKLFQKLIFLFSLMTIPLTFSRTIIFLELMLIIYSLINSLKNYNLKFKIGLLIIFSLLPLYTSSLIPGNPASLLQRTAQIIPAVKLILSHPLLGVGLGNFLPASFLFQPVHNIYLLLAAELGLPITMYLFYLIYKYLKKNLRTLPIAKSASALVILLSGMTDHYWISLHQNQLLLIIFLSLLFLPQRGKITTSK